MKNFIHKLRKSMNVRMIKLSIFLLVAGLVTLFIQRGQSYEQYEKIEGETAFEAHIKPLVFRIPIKNLYERKDKDIARLGSSSGEDAWSRSSVSENEENGESIYAAVELPVKIDEIPVANVRKQRTTLKEVTEQSLKLTGPSEIIRSVIEVEQPVSVNAPEQSVATPEQSKSTEGLQNMITEIVEVIVTNPVSNSILPKIEETAKSSTDVKVEQDLLKADEIVVPSNDKAKESEKKLDSVKPTQELGEVKVTKSDSLLASMFPQWKRKVTTASTQLPTNKKYAIAFYAAADNYACGVLVNAQRLRDLNTSHTVDIIVLIPESTKFAPFFTRGVEKLNITIIKVPNAYPQGNGYYAACMTKLYVFALDRYDRIIFMDSDSLVVRNMDELFNLPSTLLAIPRAGWLPPPAVTSWFFIVEPNATIYQTRILDKYLKGRDEGGELFDMDLINLEFGNEATILPYWLGILDSWWHNADKQSNLDWLEEKVFAVHYSSSKPWIKDMARLLETNPNPHPFYFYVWETYKELQKGLC